ncbi:chemotaxis protein CheX [Ketobacter alkanivorans]|uniref:chemotaxis protein CheX n=1 Tax=Ketobacter alkanivorans TaxID=1917421 RepID=UPI0018F8191A|nr:chemotaxis protein CheX [Ketobacter alkanivorans]
MKKINVDIVNPFLESMSNVLATMAMLEPQAGQVAIKDEDIACGEITGIIGLVGDNFKASLAVSFSRPVILEITARMLGEEITDIDDTVIDLVGEITNMVTGGAKNLLDQKGYSIGLSTPMVVTGVNHKVTHKAKGPRIVVPFTLEAGEFFVEVCFEGV